MTFRPNKCSTHWHAGLAAGRNNAAPLSSILLPTEFSRLLHPSLRSPLNPTCLFLFLSLAKEILLKELKSCVWAIFFASLKVLVTRWKNSIQFPPQFLSYSFGLEKPRLQPVGTFLGLARLASRKCGRSTSFKLLSLQPSTLFYLRIPETAETTFREQFWSFLPQQYFRALYTE